MWIRASKVLHLQKTFIKYTCESYNKRKNCYCKWNKTFVKNSVKNTLLFFEDLKHYKIVLRNVESFCITLILYDKWKRSKRDMLNIQKGLSVVQYAVCIEWVWNSIFLQQSNLESDFSFGSDFLFKFNSEKINFWYSHTMLLQL